VTESGDQIEEKLRKVKAETSIPVDKLLKAVEGELIPRLMMAHLVDIPENILGKAEVSKFSESHWSSQSNIERFAQMCADGNSVAMRSHVEGLIDDGVKIETVYILLLSPAANFLGDRWFNDTLSFIDVHLGLLKLHQLIGSLEFVGPIPELLDGKSILISTAPGDQHTFSATMVADIFKRAGWHVSNQSGRSEEFLLKKVESTPYSCIGFSLHNSDAFEPLQLMIDRIRDTCHRNGTTIVVGGDYFNRHPENADKLGADLCVLDGSVAVEEVTRHMRAYKQRQLSC